jgi:transcriptional regulator with XRE-family HTH domain
MMKVREVGKFIRDQRRTASLSLRKLSSLAGVSNPYLSQIERGLRRPSAEILKEIAKALSISAETLYIKAGILDERGDEVDTVGTIRRDPTISEKQKQILVGLYESFKSPVPATERPRHSTAGSKRRTTARTGPRAGTRKAAAPRKAAAAPRKAVAARRSTATRARTGGAKKKTKAR